MPADDRKLLMHELGRLAPAEYHPSGRRITVVLDDVRSRHNVGSIFRSADCFGVERIILCGFSPLPPHREIEKTALGATLSVPWQHAPDVAATVEELKGRGYLTIAVEQTTMAVPLPALELPEDQALALVFGNELHGVSDPVVRACDRCIVVPQRGSKHSLNVSVCAGVVLFELAGRQG